MATKEIFKLCWLNEFGNCSFFVLSFPSIYVKRQASKRDAEVRFDLKLQFIALTCPHNTSMLAFSSEKVYPKKVINVALIWRSHGKCHVQFEIPSSIHHFGLCNAMFKVGKILCGSSAHR